MTTLLALSALLAVPSVPQSASAASPKEIKARELAAAGRAGWKRGDARKAGGATFAKVPGQAAPARTAPDNTATMQYDDGVLSALPTNFGAVVGNRFSLGAGGVQLDTVTLNSFSFYFMEDSLADNSLFFQPAAPLNSMSLNARASTNITGLMNSGPNFSAPVLNVIDQTALGTTGMFNDTFFLGAWCINSATMFPVNNETIGLATNGPRQQGYSASSGVGALPFVAQPFNAILRANVTSPNTVPVELMGFDVR